MKFSSLLFGAVFLLCLALLYRFFFAGDVASENFNTSKNDPINVLTTNTPNQEIETDSLKTTTTSKVAANDQCRELDCFFPGETEESIATSYLRGHLGLKISSKTNRFYYETDKAYVISQAEQGDWDAIEILLKRLHPISFEMTRAIASRDSELAQEYAEELQVMHEFYIEDIEQRMRAYHEVAMIAAAYGKTYALMDLTTLDWSGKKTSYATMLASIYDGDDHYKEYYAEVSKDLSQTDIEAIEKDAKSLLLDVENERARLGVSSEEVRTASYALIYAKNHKQCTSEDSEQSLECLLD
ncbi:hypothetical protein L9G15_19340 [Shewanella sp. A3A]|nr:hypothetical protein [Shewanella ferrihydritica]